MTAADPKRNLARSSELPVHAPYRLCSALEYPTASVAIGWAIDVFVPGIATRHTNTINVCFDLELQRLIGEGAKSTRANVRGDACDLGCRILGVGH